MLIMIIGLAILGFASTGHFLGKPLNTDGIKSWNVWGRVLFFVGLIPSVIIVGLAFLDNLQPYQQYIISFWDLLTKFVSLPLVQFVVGGGGLLIFGVKYWRVAQAEKGYKIKADKVLDQPFISRNKTHYRSAGILVENVGNGDVTCVAKLVRFEKYVSEKKMEIVDIKELNPNGYYLQWDDGRAFASVGKYRPRKIELADNYEERDFFRHGRLLFDNSYIRHLDVGKYFVEIDILRLSGGRGQIKMYTIEGILGIEIYYDKSPSPISGDGVFVLWIEKERGKSEKSKTTKGRKKGSPH